MVRGMFAIAVANSKGGSGKTTIATHLAARFAAEGRHTILADLGHPVVARLRDAQLYAAAAASGVTLFDQPPSARGARDHLAEWRPLLRFIDEAT